MNAKDFPNIHQIFGIHMHSLQWLSRLGWGAGADAANIAVVLQTCNCCWLSWPHIHSQNQEYKVRQLKTISMIYLSSLKDPSMCSIQYKKIMTPLLPSIFLNKCCNMILDIDWKMAVKKLGPQNILLKPIYTFHQKYHSQIWAIFIVLIMLVFFKNILLIFKLLVIL